jgi:hypothetical protein
MRYLDIARLAALDAEAFRSQQPYPWVNPEGLLTEDGYRRLVETLPDAAMFERRFGLQRAHGQRSHDRLALEYRRGLDLAPEWHAFVAELGGADYMRFLRRMFGRRLLRLKFHWHYTPRGCSVSPHCDAPHKIGSHIFCFNTAADWDPAWGGQTLILDDGGRLHRRSSPGFEDFDRVITAENLGNRSVLFQRRGDSWHGVRELTCPEGALRKVFIVVVDDPVRAFGGRLGKRLRGKPVSDY